MIVAHDFHLFLKPVCLCYRPRYVWPVCGILAILQFYYNYVSHLSTGLQMGTHRTLHINSLPEEVLRQIFLEHVLWCRSGYEKSPLSGKRKPYIWLRVAFVCRLWRTVAIEYPTLWSVIVVTHPLDCIRVMIQRARRLDLDIQPTWKYVWKIHMPSRTISPAVQDIICNEIPRTRKLDLSFAENQTDFLCRILEALEDAPKLEYLSLNSQMTFSSHRELHLSLFNSPRLNHASIRSLTLSHPLSRTLRSLLLFNVAVPPSALWTALALMSHLTSITLCYSIKEIPSQPYPSIHFPELRDIFIKETPQACLWLLSNIVLPTSVWISTAWHDTISANPSDLLSLISAKLDLDKASTGPRLSALYLAPAMSGDRPRFNIIGWKTPPQAGKNPLRRKEDFRIQVNNVNAANLDFLIETLEQNFALDRLESVSFDFETQSAPLFTGNIGHVLGRMLRAAKSVHTLFVNRWFAGDLTEFLLYPQEEAPIHNEGFPYVLPCLRHLHVSRLDWSLSGEQNRLNRRFDLSRDCETLRQDCPLFEALRMRQERGGELKDLRIEGRKEYLEPLDAQRSLDLINGIGASAPRVRDFQVSYHQTISSFSHLC